MAPERWRQIEELFQEAVAVPPEGRETFLKQACAGDEALRAEVLSLLAADDPETPLATFSLDSGMEGERIGPYRVIRLLGSGGMGSVYLAVRDDDQFKKQVAIKLLKRGMDTEFMLNRFRQERQILANLEHPFIARLLDGGATGDGLPYFVMEYVDGRSITAHCAGEKLSLTERLAVFRLVCEAVQYAHQNLVVHRDLKPGNILITKEGIPKLLDFGIAKLIHADRLEDGTLTRHDLRFMTPEYASPEQAMGVSLTTASDIYALGAILYELLTTRRPHHFTSSSPVEIERTICQVEPAKPGLSSDLDNIILTAMRKEPQRRYASAAELSEDIRRYLEGHPVMAHEDRWTYRAGKFIRRHKLGVIAAVALIASLLGGIIATTIQARRAERRFQLVRQLARSVLADVNRMAELPGSTPLRVSMIQTVVQYLDSLAGDTSRDPAFDFEIADAYQLVASIEGHPLRPNLGRFGPALSHYEKALDIYARHTARPDTRGRALSSTISSLIESSDIEARTGNARGAAERLRRVSAIAAEVEARDPSELTPGTWTYIYFRLGDVELRKGNADVALDRFRKAVEITKIDPSPTAGSTLRGAYNRMARAQLQAGDLSGALAQYTKALEMAEEIARRPDANTYERSNVMGAHKSLGDVLGNPEYLNSGNLPAAFFHYEQALRMGENFVAADPHDVRARIDLADVYRCLADLWRDRDVSEARKYFRKALAISEELSTATPPSLLSKCHLAVDLIGIASTMRNADSASRGIELLKSIIAAAPEETWLRELSKGYAVLASVQLDRGEKAEALRNCQAGLDAAEKLLARNPATAAFQLVHADALEALSRCHLRIGDPTRANTYLQKSRDIWKDWIARKVAVPYATRRLADFRY